VNAQASTGTKPKNKTKVVEPKQKNGKTTLDASIPMEEVIITIAGDSMLQNKLPPGGILNPQPGPHPTDEDRQANWKNKGHWTKEKKLGFPVEAFTSAMAAVVKNVKLSGKVKYGKDVKRAIRILPDDRSEDGKGLILFSKYKAVMSSMFAYPPRNPIPMPAIRLEAQDWEATLRIVYDKSLLSNHDVILLVARAGLSNGIGAFRKENGGEYGCFKVTKANTRS
jgi:hypothetical protein